jgi:hypothetical protein
MPEDTVVETENEGVVNAVTTVSGRQVYNHNARLKWWYIISEHKIEFLQRLRGDKCFTGKKVYKKNVHDEIVRLMATDVGEHSQKFRMTSDQSKGLYSTLKKAHENYCLKPSGSAAGAPPPEMFLGFWNSYNQSFSQCLNLSPVFRADPSDTRIGVEASLVPRNDDENTSSELNNDDDTDEHEGEDENNEIIGEGGGESSSSKKRKKSSSKDVLYDFLQESRKDRKEDLARREKEIEMQERTVKAAEAIADTGNRFLNLLEKKWA